MSLGLGQLHPGPASHQGESGLGCPNELDFSIMQKCWGKECGLSSHWRTFPIEKTFPIQFLKEIRYSSIRLYILA